MEPVKADIAATLEYYGANAVPGGSRYRKMRCPFHEDRNASASVCTDDGRFRCFVCDVNGDAIDVVRWKEGLDYLSAVEFLTGTIGIGVPNVREQSNERSRPVFGEPRVHKGQRDAFSARLGRKSGPWS